MLNPQLLRGLLVLFGLAQPRIPALVFLVGLARPRLPTRAGGTPLWEPGRAGTAIPKTLYTYWSGTPDALAEKCIEKMRKLHPDWKLVRLEDVKVEETEGLDRLGKVQHLSDWVRLCALEEHGGVYLDASVVCMRPVEEWLDLALAEVQGFSGFWGDGSLENWAIAAPPRHPLISAWRAELRRAIAIGYDEYIKQAPDAARRYGITLQLPYLTAYACFLVASEKTGRRACTHPSPEGPYHYMHEWGWTPLGVRALKKKPMPSRPPPLIKLGRYQRKWLRRFQSVEGSYWDRLGLGDDACEPRGAGHAVGDFFESLVGSWLCIGTDVAARFVESRAVRARRGALRRQSEAVPSGSD